MSLAGSGILRELEASVGVMELHQQPPSGIHDQERQRRHLRTEHFHCVSSLPFATFAGNVVNNNPAP